MKSTLRAVLAGSLAISITLGLSACHRHTPSPSATAAPAEIVVSGAKLVLPAVKGRPAAAYFTIANGEGSSITLASIAIAGAQSTEMHETKGGEMAPLANLRINPGQQVIFAPGGKHVMVFGLAPTLKAGGSAEMKLRFVDGKTSAASLKVEAAGGGADDMAGMKM